MASQGKGKGGMAKRGRNISKCSHYKIMNFRLSNKIRRLIKHINNNANDKLAKKALNVLT